MMSMLSSHPSTLVRTPQHPHHTPCLLNYCCLSLNTYQLDICSTFDWCVEGFAMPSMDAYSIITCNARGWWAISGRETMLQWEQ